MKAISIFIVLLQSIAYSQMDTLALEYEHYRLPNGLEVVLQPDKSVNNVSVEFWLKNGTSMDKPSEYGLQHFFEHVLPTSPMDSIKRRTLFRKFYENSNAQVKKDFSRFYLEVKPQGLELALEWNSGRLKAGPERITNKIVERERKRVLDEIARNAMYPIWSAPGSLKVSEGTFGKNHPYAATGYGTVANNKQFVLEDFRKRYAQIVHASNVILFVVGNFELEETKKLISKYYGPVPEKEQSLATQAVFKEVHQTSESITMKAPHPKDSLNTMVFSWAIPKLNLKEDATAQFLAAHLNNIFTAKVNIFPSVVSSSVEADIYKQAGQFLIQIGLKHPNHIDEIRNIVLNSIDELVKEPLSNSELELARKQEIKTLKEKQQYLGFEWSRTELLGQGLLNYKNPNAYFERLELQESITNKDMQRASSQWFSNVPFQIVFLAND